MYRVEVKKIINSNKFRQAAISYQTNGYYTPHPRGTTAYLKYWEEETKRCLEGYIAGDGDWISGYNYFYLNYSPILIAKDKEIERNGKKIKKIGRDRDFPNFWDYDKVFFDTVEEAENNGRHLAFLKPRGIGASFKGSSMLCRNYFLIPESTSLAITEETESLIKDGILTKAWDIVDFINEHTAWSKKAQKVNTKLHKRASFVVDNGNTLVEMGYKSEIIGISVKNNPDKPRGKRYKLCIVDEIGLITNPIHLFSSLRHGAEEDGEAFGLIILQGTGGKKEADYSEMRKLYYEPDIYNLLEVENIWDDGKQGTTCGLFWPRYYNMRGFMDEDGNSLINEARKYEQIEREKIITKASDKNQIDTLCAERPFCVDGNTWMSSNEYGLIRIKNNKNSVLVGKKEVFELTTKNFRKLICTDDHPIYNGKDYIKLKDLKIGDVVKVLPVNFNKDYQNINIKTKLNIANFSILINEDWGKFIGLFMGDGSFYKNSLEIVFDKKDEESLDWTIKFVEKYFKDSYQITHHGSNNGAWRIRVNCKEFNDIFVQLDLLKRTEKNLMRYIHVPDYIIKSPKSVVSAFLSGLFDSDGYITSAKSKRIGFFSKHEDFIKDVIILLSGFNIYPSFGKSDKINGEGRRYIGRRLLFGGDYVSIFKKEIRFISSRKNKLLDSHVVIKRRNIDRSLDKIVSVESVGLRDVYDITTLSHYFSANSLWVHNCPEESLLQVSGNIFPKKELLNHLTYIQTNETIRSYKQVGNLIFGPNGVLQWVQQDKPRDIIKYNLHKAEDKEGAIVIWEHPELSPPWGLYIAGNDPYDHNQAESSTSLGSIFIYKGFHSIGKTSDTIVAEYTGRPNSADDFYENVRKLLLYYNATCLYENQWPGLSVYMRNKHSDYLLADQPSIISKIIQDSRVHRGKGVHMTNQLKDWAELRIRDWLIEEYEPGKLNLTKILSEPLLEELISYNGEINTDRVIALMMIMIYKEELHNLHIKYKEEVVKTKRLFESPIFSRDRDFYTFN